jgi:serine/threonine protein kinase
MDIRNVYIPENCGTFQDVYVVSELIFRDLASLLRSDETLQQDHVRFFLYQILRGIKYLHSAEVLHRDLKPRNLLVNNNCDLKICDFGLAKIAFSKEDFDRGMTEYVQTRWYRSPEILCSWKDYGKPTDLWSIGCILGEMSRRRPLFRGSDTQDQLRLIIYYLGKPDSSVLQRIPYEKCRNFVRDQDVGPSGNRLLRQAAGGYQGAFDMLSGLLVINPDQRLNVEEALKMPWMSTFYDPTDEPTRGPLDIADFEFERRKLTIEALREEIFLEVLHHHPQRRERYLAWRKATNNEFDIKSCRLLEPNEEEVYSEEELVDQDQQEDHGE